MSEINGNYIMCPRKEETIISEKKKRTEDRSLEIDKKPCAGGEETVIKGKNQPRESLKDLFKKKVEEEKRVILY